MAFFSPSSKSVARYQGKAPWMLKKVAAGRLLTFCNNGWKSAPAKSVQLFNQPVEN